MVRKKDYIKSKSRSVESSDVIIRMRITPKQDVALRELAAARETDLQTLFAEAVNLILQMEGKIEVQSDYTHAILELQKMMAQMLFLQSEQLRVQMPLSKTEHKKIWALSQQFAIDFADTGPSA